MPLPIILPPAVLNVADRLSTILMALFDAIGPISVTGTPTFPDHAVQALFFRLVHLIHTLIRIDNFGIRAPAKPATRKARTEPAPVAQRSDPAQRFPNHPGWLLAALPDIAPAIAADLEAILADPDLIALLAAAPTLHRTLRPLLRGLGLTQSPRPDPSPTPPHSHPEPPHPARPGLPNHGLPSPAPPPKLPRQIDPILPRFSHAQIVPI